MSGARRNGERSVAPAPAGASAHAPLPYSCAVQVRFRDVDAMNHVNNAVFVTYLEVARERLWRERLGLSGSARDFPFILARVAVDFRSPIHLGEEVRVEVGVGRIGTSSFTFLYRVFAGDRLSGEAETVQVMYDYERGRTTPLSEAMRAALAALLWPPRHD